MAYKNPPSPLYASRRAVVSPLGQRGAPASLDESSRSCEFVLTTEQPVQVWDWERWEQVPEVLRVDGAVYPTSGQCPLLDTHSRFSQADQLGSTRDFASHPARGAEPACITGRGYFSTVRDADEAWTKVREGHLTDVSVGYEILAHTWIEPGVTAMVNGIEYTGPVRVVTGWKLLEVSLCPIGADPAAKARASGKHYKLTNLEEQMETKKQAGQRADAAGENQVEIAPTPETGQAEGQGDSVADIVAAKVEAALAETLPKLVAATVAEALTAKPADLKAENQENPETLAEARSKAQTAERARIAEITAMCDKFNIDQSSRSRYINGGHSADSVRKAVMEQVELRGGGASYATVSVGETEQSKVRAACLDGLLLRAGARLDKPAPGAGDFRHMSLREICREFLERSGLSGRGPALDVVGRALTTTDLPLLLTEGVQRMLMEGWQQAAVTWDQWASVGSATDFRKNLAVGIDFDLELKRVPENGEYTYSYATEYGEEYQLATYGRIFPLTRQALINDDLGVFSRIATAQGEGAAKTVNKLAYAVLGKNRPLRNGNRLFSAAHANLVQGGGTPTVTSLETADTALGMQVDSYGNPLQIEAEFYLAPRALKASSEAFFKNEYIGTQEYPTTRNTYFGQFNRVYDRELDRYSSTDWYLLGPKGKTVMLAFLNGQQSPTLEERRGWTVDGMEYKVRIDATGTALAAQGMAKSSADPAAPTPDYPDEFSPLSSRKTNLED